MGLSQVHLVESIIHYYMNKICPKAVQKSLWDFFQVPHCWNPLSTLSPNLQYGTFALWDYFLVPQCKISLTMYPSYTLKNGHCGNDVDKFSKLVRRPEFTKWKRSIGLSIYKGAFTHWRIGPTYSQRSRGYRTRRERSTRKANILFVPWKLPVITDHPYGTQAWRWGEWWFGNLGTPCAVHGGREVIASAYVRSGKF